MKITVLMGGWSPEREVSLASGANVASELTNLGYEIYVIDVKKDLRYLVDELYKSDPDLIFNMLHGIGGEDGVIQGILEVFGKPYTGCGVLSSALCFDKSITKKLINLNGVQVANSIDITSEEFLSMDPCCPALPYPFVIKPEANGSSVGVFIINNNNELKSIQKQGWDFGRYIMIEEYIKGREFTVLVESGKTTGAVEIVPKNEFYDYASKYDDDGSRHIPDFEMLPNHKDEMFKMAEKAYMACKCSGIARIDFIYDGRNSYCLELNTQPGMTNISLVPDIYRSINKSTSELARSIIKTAHSQ